MRVVVKFKNDETNEFTNIKDVKMYYGVIELVFENGSSTVFERENVKNFILDVEKNK